MEMQSLKSSEFARYFPAAPDAADGEAHRIAAAYLAGLDDEPAPLDARQLQAEFDAQAAAQAIADRMAHADRVRFLGDTIIPAIWGSLAATGGLVVLAQVILAAGRYL